MRTYTVYILASRSRTLTARYNITRLVYVETTRDVNAAIAREKQLKRWVRRKKSELIERTDPGWDDLAPHSCADPSPRSARSG